MAYKLKVLNCNPKTDYGPNGAYTYYSLEVEYNGKKSERKVFPGTITKYPHIEGVLKTLTPGMFVEVTMVQNGQYKEMADIKPVTGNGETTTYSKNTSTSSYDSIGAQVGNALTNACRTLPETATIKHIEARAWELILLGEELKTRISNKDHINNKPPFDPALQDQAAHNSTEMDVPF